MSLHCITIEIFKKTITLSYVLFHLNSIIFITMGKFKLQKQKHSDINVDFFFFFGLFCLF